MIPTTSTNLPTPQTAATAMIGIASIILEGRTLIVDEYSIDNQKNSENINSCIENNTTSNHKIDKVDPTIQHFNRLRQKLGQLRQSSPGTSHDLIFEQGIVISNDNNNLQTKNYQSDTDDEELENFGHPNNKIKPLQQQQQQQLTYDSNLLNTLQTLASTCLRTTTPCNYKFNRNRDITIGNVEIFRKYNKNILTTMPSTSTTSSINNENVYNLTDLNQKSLKIQLSNRNEKISSLKQGPHCDQFLKKLGFGKIESNDIEEHSCDMSNLNDICCRWQFHCRQIEGILSRSDPICIEVYLGPESHEILLEQWIIQQVESSQPPNMTLQLLSNAIRSQLYFSQITAWTDLLKNTKTFDKDILDNARIKKYNNGTHLDILYRIKSYDSTACFNLKPNVHNFPNVLLTENCLISVCLKSLPRINGNLPKIDDKLFGQNKLNKTNDLTTTKLQNNNLLTTCRDDVIMVDDRLDLPCYEKGKHKCPYDDEEINSDIIIDEVILSTNNTSHRERQLMKYRKRIMKRDKKVKRIYENSSSSSSPSSSPLFLITIATATTTTTTTTTTTATNQNDQIVTKINLNSIHNNQQEQFPSITNTIQNPQLLQLIGNNITETIQTTNNTIEMISVATQTNYSTNNYNILPNCNICDTEMQLVCTDCNENKPINDFLLKKSNDSSDININLNNSCKNIQQNSNNDIILQAIQRVPRPRPHDARNNNNNNNNNNNITSNNNNNNNTLSSGTVLNNRFTSVDCQLCKRQKTKHHYNLLNNDTPTTSSSYLNEEKFHKNLLQLNDCNCYNNENISINTKNNDDIINNKKFNINGQQKINVLNNKIKNNNDNNLDDIKKEQQQQKDIQNKTIISNEFKLIDDIDKQFKTPKTNQLKPLPLYLDYTEKIINNIKQYPKINLINYFNTPTTKISTIITSSSTNKLITSSPIPIDILKLDLNNISSPDINVQKSNSAPALPYSSTLSPRFIKQSTIYRRRVRHLSDCSDEQISDEDIDLNYSPVTSPIKNRIFSKLNQFGRKQLLGSLEESLLQKRLIPKTQVTGYKVLLGASGIFCPTQLTLPSAAYFYELTGQTMSTPYLCEVRLPRKGYTIPRTGTVQVTLLNPLGTVVRMFVVPYDFCDMPAMSQTFIRQRILAFDGNNQIKIKDNKMNEQNYTKQNTSVCGLQQFDIPFGEQMRHLRYTVHLRFQTSRSGRLSLHTDIRLIVSRRTDCDTAAAHAKGALESPNDLRIITVLPDSPKYSLRSENPNKI